MTAVICHTVHVSPKHEGDTATLNGRDALQTHIPAQDVLPFPAALAASNECVCPSLKASVHPRQRHDCVIVALWSSHL